MATVDATRNATGFPVHSGDYGNCHAAWGTINLTSNYAATTTYGFFRLPRGAKVFFGAAYAADLEAGSDELDIDIGWAANGDEVADPDGFGNFGVWTGAAVSLLVPVAGNLKFFQGVLLTAGPKTFNAETEIIATVNVDAHTGGTGQITAFALYTTQ